MNGHVIANRYDLKQDVNGPFWYDERLQRRIFIHPIPHIGHQQIVRQRLAQLQTVQSPYLALVYDLVPWELGLGVVEESMPKPITITAENRLLHLYEFCAGLAALHEKGLAHGKLGEYCFGEGALGRGRLCNLAFVGSGLDNPDTDRLGFISQMTIMEAGAVHDPIWQWYWQNLGTGQWRLDVRALRDRLKALVLKDSHRALINWRGTSVELSKIRRGVTLTHPNPSVPATVRIEYDGTRFFIDELAGEVHINNQSFSIEQELPQSCVIVLGNASRPWTERYSITFDQSHPEVI